MSMAVGGGFIASYRSETTTRSSDSPCLLVVDDDRELASVISRRMERLGIRVAAAHDVSQALAAASRDSFDVVLLDLRMTNVDGFEVLEALRSSAQPPEIILHSGYLDVQTTVAAMRGGAAEVLEKPVEFDLLVERVRHFTRVSRSRRAQSQTTGSDPPALSSLLGESEQMRDLKHRIRCVSAFGDMSVLIEGPTGTGKELVARAIHDLGAAEHPFVTLNCAAVPEQLFESELFGHEAGAFTSARGTRAGLLEEAGRGTLFLDEIGEMPLQLQPKLLRVLETGEFRRVGANKIKQLTARVVSASNRELSAVPEIFRPDLYYRLAGYTIRTSALAERMSDLPVLAHHFLAQFCSHYNLKPKSLSAAAIRHLQSHHWPGNVRELRRVVESAAMLCPTPTLDPVAVNAALPRDPELAPPSSGFVERDNLEPPAPTSTSTTLPELQRELIHQAFRESGENLSLTARQLGIPRSTLRDRLRRYGLR